MRRSIVFLAPLTLGLLAVFACDDSSGGNFGTIDLDAGNVNVVVPIPSTEIDAAVDAGADADAAAPTTVTVSVLGSAAARTGVEIVFNDATGAVLETKLTGADGKATSSTAATPASATALLKDGTQRYSIVTWTGVAGGDVLTLRAFEPSASPALVGTFDITATAVADGAGQPDFQASSLCTLYPDGQPLHLDVAPPCVFGATTSVLGHAYKQDESEVYAFKKNVALPGALTPLALDGWAAPATATMSATSVPDESSVRVSLFEISAGAPFHEQSNFLDGASATFGIATGFADALQAAFRIDPYASSHGTVIVRKSAVTSMTADLANPLPAVAIPGEDFVTGDAARPTFHWTGDTAATSGGVFQVAFAGSNEEASYNWTILVPGGATTVTAPALPADAAAFLPGTLGDYRSYSSAVAFVAGAGLTPAAVRAGAFAAVDVTDNGPEATFTSSPLPIDGTIKVTSYFDARL